MLMKEGLLRSLGRAGLRLYVVINLCLQVLRRGCQGWHALELDFEVEGAIALHKALDDVLGQAEELTGPPTLSLERQDRRRHEGHPLQLSARFVDHLSNNLHIKDLWRDRALFIYRRSLISVHS